MAFEDFSQYGDHPNYHELYISALQAAQNAPRGAIAVEVGVREGGSALTLLNALRDAGRNQWLLTIDPHGDKPYLSRDQEISGMGYNDPMYRKFMRHLSTYADDHNLNWAHFKLKSLDWTLFWDAVEFWAGGEVLPKEFFFVHLDGDHTDWVVRDEIDYFMPRLLPGGVLTVDDADQIDPEACVGGRDYKVEYNRVWLKSTSS